jgi:hypothetical protein
MNILMDSSLSDSLRRQEIYRGSLFLNSPSPSAKKLCELARRMLQEAFAPRDPLTLHDALQPEQSAAILAELKPKFIHHPQSKEYVSGMLEELGYDMDATYFDVPRLRTAFPGDYLKSGIAYAFHPHRDTWYSAPFSQINWWMPVYEILPENCMAIHPYHWSNPVANGSRNYNYHRWNLESRQNAAAHVKTDTRVQPRPEGPVTLEPEIRLVCPPAACYQFSAAQLHSTVPNTTAVIRYSIDFRTVDLRDLRDRNGAPNVDSACTGTTIRDYIQAHTFRAMPEDVAALYLDGTEKELAKA